MRLPLPKWLAIVTGLIVLLPVLLTDMPPLLDYPNHVVRFWLLSGGASHPPVSGFFRIDWSHTATNIGMDILARILGWATPAHITGRIILGLSAILPPLGLVLVSRRLYGRLSWWHIWLCLTAWPMVLLTGFMSFQLALGTALIAVWLDLIWCGQPWRLRLARQSLQGLIVILIHPFGALFYFILTTALCPGDTFTALRNPVERVASLRRWAIASAPFVIAGVLVALRIVLFGQQGDEGGMPGLSWYDPALKDLGPDHIFWSFIGPLRSYSLPVDLAFVGLLWLPVIVSLIQKRLRLHAGLVVVGGALFAFSVVCPQGIGSTSMIDVRLWTMALLIMPIAVFPDVDLGRRSLAILCSLALCVTGARSLWLEAIWHGRQADVRSLYRAMDHVPTGAKVLPLMVEADEDAAPTGRWLGGMTPTFEHLPTLAVMRRQAYVPTVFAEPGKQPVTVMPPYDETHEVSGGLLGTPDDLRHENGDAASYLPHWQSHFDYVLLINADMDPARLPPDSHTCLVTDQGFARLYRVC